ncbi:LuxR C-terminal-related transcriptional regulator [Streptomyces sp. NPDC090106]|uniref:LuxR C-terminal-related transcriptional regulator n=1 Tax=Streptomyces sp. NPDC090106 TaxID=3365946 RepID=UPI0037FD121F
MNRREREVLPRLGEGRSDTDVARRPGAAEATVKTHVSRLPAGPEPRGRAQAAAPVGELGA